ncbi:MAG TPA: ABC transporter ATP-binding protein [bacterium]|nr:ABC transporter ATP-binding protein [bacterium]
MTQPVLSVKNLQTQFHTGDGVVRAVDGISFDLMPGTTLGIVGESGCGKSVTHLSFLGLIPTPPGRIAGGSALFKGRDLISMKKEELRSVRGNDIAVIFQDPMTSLNPFMRISRQMTEGLEIHKGMQRKEALARAVELLDSVGIPSAEKRVHDFPHQFSGGMRQRVMIAMALACEPAILIADEPTTALDVTIQAQILELLQRVQNDTGAAIIMITHDLGVVAGICENIVVMYAGRIVEKAATGPLFERPLHPYTYSLLRSIPRLDSSEKEKLFSIPGMPPDLIRNPEGCNFSPRCPFAIDRCFREDPALAGVEQGREIACWVDIESKEARS